MGAGQPFVGEIILFAGNYAPTGWSFCDGTLLSIAQNTALFSLLGTTYGGNGQTNFGLPDLRGRVPMFFGQGPGLSSRSLGESGGTENSTLTLPQIPVHTHALSVQNVNGTTNLPVANPLATPPTNTTWAVSAAGVKNYATSAAATPLGAMAPAALQSVGGSQAHNNMQPSIGLNFIIARQGVYPSHP